MPVYQTVIVSRGIHFFILNFIWAGIQIFAPEGVRKAVVWLFETGDPYFFYVNEISPVAIAGIGFLWSLYDASKKKYVSYSGIGMLLNGLLILFLSAIMVL